MTEKPLSERFWQKVRKTDQCWIWTAATSSGYGVIYEKKRAWKGAHRVSYEMHYGPIAQSMHVDHVCGYPLCVRPDHLQVVTHAENVRRGKSSNGLRLCRLYCRRGHPLFGPLAKIFWRKKSERPHCKVCHQWSRPSIRTAEAKKKHADAFKENVYSKPSKNVVVYKCKNGHVVHGENLLVDKSGHRRCRICRSRQQLAKRLKRKATVKCKK